MPSDYAAILEITEDNPAYPFPGLGNTFPKSERTIPNSGFQGLAAIEVSWELALQLARLNHHAPKLAGALGSLAQINAALTGHAFEEAEAIIAAHKEAYGLSFILVKKELLLALTQHGLAGLARRFKRLTGGHERTSWALLCHFVYDAMDPTFHPCLAMRAWLQGLAKWPAKREFFRRLIVDEILTQSESDLSLSSTLLRFSGVSLLDVAILLWRKRTVHPRDMRLQGAFTKLDASLKDLLVEKFSRLSIDIPHVYWRSRKSPTDVEVYRASFLFSEIASIAAWRCHINGLIFGDYFKAPGLEHEKMHRQLDEAAATIAAAPGRCQNVIEDLAAWEKSFLHPGSRLDDQKFLTAAVVTQSLRKLAQGSGADPTEVSYLLASIENLDLYTSVATLQKLLNTGFSHGSPLLCFILLEIIYRQVRTQDNELERRLAFMKLLNGGACTQIIDLFDEISLASTDTAILMARICTRPFLERLYLVMTSVKDVIETRLRICRWLLDHEVTVDDGLREECDALEREIANLDARSDLDSTRVHVDEESLREWFKLTQLVNVTRYIQTVLAEGPATDFGSLLDFYPGREKADSADEDLTVETQIGSEFLLVDIVDATLTAFALDRTFGLDAYLSRRIRHGTLSGHLITPVTRILSKRSADPTLRG